MNGNVGKGREKGRTRSSGYDWDWIGEYRGDDSEEEHREGECKTYHDCYV